MIRINLFGGPGAGKSTMAAMVFGELKNRGVNVELVREVVKWWAYAGRRLDAWDQVLTFGQQLNEEHHLAKAGVEVVVSDSPLLLQSFYSADNAGELAVMAKRYETLHPSINYFVERTKKYNPLGRFQKEDEAREVDLAMAEYLNANGVKYGSVGNFDYLMVLIESDLKRLGLPLA